ncbi:MAG: tryptophan--tRNA ligase, partial [Bacteroidales bacterium]|nr:tryptophan--tRNA ligase [Bacteroidales bacterium]
LAAILNDTLAPIRARRAALEQDIPAVWEVLRRGTEAAVAEASATLRDVRRAMRIEYFEDSALIGGK